MVCRRLYDQYSFQVIPPMGTVLAGDWKSYQYLVESIRRFPNQVESDAMARQILIYKYVIFPGGCNADLMALATEAA